MKWPDTGYPRSLFPRLVPKRMPTEVYICFVSDR